MPQIPPSLLPLLFHYIHIPASPHKPSHALPRLNAAFITMLLAKCVCVVWISIQYGNWLFKCDAVWGVFVCVCVCVCVSLCMYEGLLCGMFLFWLSQSMRAQLLMP